MDKAAEIVRRYEPFADGVVRDILSLRDLPARRSDWDPGAPIRKRSMSRTCTTCRELLADALDLRVRARGLDACNQREAELAALGDLEGWAESGGFEQHNIQHPESPIATRSATVRFWAQDQYEADLAAWEAKARHHLMQGCESFAPLARPDAP